MIFPGALGDFLLALPTLRALRGQHPGARATLVVGEPLRALAAVAGPWDDVRSLDGAETAGLFGGTRRPGWLEGVDLVVSWLGASDPVVRTRVTAMAARARFFSVERGTGVSHAAVAYARATGLGLDAEGLARGARIDPPRSAVVDALLEGAGAPRLAVHPGAGARAKRWDAAGFVQVAQWWRRAGGAVVEIVGPAEAGDLPLLGGVTARDLSLPDLAALLHRADAYLGNDSGVSHLAAAVGACGVALFGPTSRRRWRPIGSGIHAMQAERPGTDGISLAALPPARVIGALARHFTLTSRNPAISVLESFPPGVSDGPRVSNRQE